MQHFICRITGSVLFGTVALATAHAQPPESATALSLGDAARMAANETASVTTARYRTEQYAARADQSRAELLPSVTASLSDGQRTFNTASFGLPFPGFDPNGTIIGPVRTVDVRGRVVADLYAPATLGRYRTAQAEERGAAADAEAVAESAATAAALAYVRAMRADARVVARAADSALAFELLDIARSQLSAGTGVALDVTRAEAQLADVRSQLIGARNERDRARIELLRAVGRPSTDQVALTDSLHMPETITPVPALATALAEARRNRPELSAADAAVEVERRTVSATRAERLPTLGVFADQGATSTSYTHLLHTYTYGVQLSIPIWEGGQHSARMAEHSASLRAAESRRDDLDQQVQTDVALALVDLASAQEQVDASRDRYRLAEQEIEQARDRFSAGVAGNADVIAAQLGLDNARSQQVDVLAALEAARIALARAEGRVTSLP